MQEYEQVRSPENNSEHLRLEAVTACVGFDDFLDETLRINHSFFDHFVVVTNHTDKATQGVAKKYGATCVQTDLFQKNGRLFNKGAAINAGMDRFQYHGWRLHLDADIILPTNFRTMLFNHTHLDTDCLYGADRVNVVGLDKLKELVFSDPQFQHSCLLTSQVNSRIETRYIDKLRGYCPIGYFQLWHSSCQHSYPYSLGTAAHDDVMFCDGWPRSQRRLLPSVICYHLCAQPPKQGENWDGDRKQPRLK